MSKIFVISGPAGVGQGTRDVQGGAAHAVEIVAAFKVAIR